MDWTVIILVTGMLAMTLGYCYAVEWNISYVLIGLLALGCCLSILITSHHELAHLLERLNAAGVHTVHVCK